MRQSKKVIISLTVLALTGCGNFNLGYVHPQAGKSSEQQQLDTLTCKDKAELAANTAGRQTGAFFLGMTIIGLPVAYELDKSKQREVFADCLVARGYKVSSQDIDKSLGTTLKAQTIAKPSPSPEVEKLTNSPLPSGFRKLDLSDTLKAGGWQLLASNKTLDIDFLASIFKRDSITDLKVYATSRKAAQESILTDTKATEVFSVIVNGREATRYEVSGTLKTGLKVTYQVTFLENNQSILQISVWTAVANFTPKKEAIESIPGFLIAHL